MVMKRTGRGLSALAAAAIALLLLASCSGGGDTLSGSLTGISEKVIAAANAALGDKEMPQLLDTGITSDNSQGMLGIDAATFDANVKEAVAYTAAINAIACEFALVKCKDAKSAQDTMAAMAQGFDSGKWICVRPEQSLVQASGSYVLLFAGRKDAGDAVSAAFSEAAKGNASEPDIFFVAETDEGDGPIFAGDSGVPDDAWIDEDEGAEGDADGAGADEGEGDAAPLDISKLKPL